MSAPVLLSDYRMTKKARDLKREAEAPVTMAFMREFRAEMNSRFAEIQAQFKQVNARIDQVGAKIDHVDAKLMTKIHQVQLTVEEQNLRNRQAYDAAAITSGALEDLRARIKPECLKD